MVRYITAFLIILGANFPARAANTPLPFHTKWLYGMEYAASLADPVIINQLFDEKNDEKRIMVNAGKIPGDMYAVKVFNVLGEYVYCRFVNHKEGTLKQLIILPADTRKGTYYAEIVNSRFKAVQKFVIQ